MPKPSNRAYNVMTSKLEKLWNEQWHVDELNGIQPQSYFFTSQSPKAVDLHRNIVLRFPDFNQKKKIFEDIKVNK